MNNQSDISTAATRVNAELKGKTALVTGGSRGIGKAIALELARRGANVAICARSEEHLKSAQVELKSLSNDCLASVCDVRNAESVSKLVQRVREELGPISILVNNAGIYKTEPLQTHSTEVWHEVLDVNLTSVMLMCRAALGDMTTAGWGRVINISSISGRTGEIWGSAYSASKFGMIGLTQSLALEMAKHGITVNAVCPGWVATEMALEQFNDPEWCNLTGTTPEDAMSNACFAVPQNRLIEPEEVAALVAFLASESARGITGQSINICGGLSLQ
jgi:NAD(P)-dependent dehydrogenase (short-subunit alcohol dehydrogenase family)